MARPAVYGQGRATIAPIATTLMAAQPKAIVTRLPTAAVLACVLGNGWQYDEFC